MNIDRVGIKLQTENGFLMLDSLGLQLKWRKISTPKGRTAYDTIPGMQGAFDSTEQFGEILYDMRDLAFDLVSADDDLTDIFKKLSSKYHCHAVDIMFTSDPEYYWSGRISINTYDTKSHTISMTAKVYPFKFKMRKTAYKRTVQDSVTLHLSNELLPVSPVITTTGPITASWDEYTKTISGSNYPMSVRVAGLRLTEGITDLTITGSATVTVEYREGAL